MALSLAGGAGTELLVGRLPECNLVLVDEERDEGAQLVSRRHAKLIRGACGWGLEDKGSANGTTINGISVVAGAAVELYEGDVVEFGQGAGAEKYDVFAHVVLGVGHLRPPPPPSPPSLSAAEARYMESVKTALESGICRLGPALGSNNVEAAYSVAGGVVLGLKEAMETLQLRRRAEGRHQQRGERADRQQRRFDEHNTETGTATARKRRKRGKGGGKGGGAGVRKPQWGGGSGSGGRRGGGHGVTHGGRGGGGRRGGGGTKVHWSGV